MKISTDAMIVAGALGVAAFLAAQDSRQEWTMSPSREPDMVRFHIVRSRPGNSSSHSWDVPVADFQGLNMNAGLTHFEYVQDAGTLLCEGRFLLGRGSGTFQVKPNPRFISQLNDLGYDSPGNDDIYTMIFVRVSLDFARGVRDAGLHASTRQLIEMRIHGLTLPFIKEVRAAGLTDVTPGDLIQLKIHGVSTEFIHELKRAGYEISTSRITELKIHGVSGQFIRDLNAYGLKPSASDLVQFKIHGVTPEFLKSLKDAGYENLAVGQVTDMKIHGVSPQFVRESKDLGYDFTQRELIDLKIHGVDGGYLRKIRESGIRNLTASQIMKLKIHGID